MTMRTPPISLLWVRMSNHRTMQIRTGPRTSPPCPRILADISPDEQIDGTGIGLDNDGDGVYDTNDSDCGAVAASPGEASGPASSLMQVTALVGGNLTVAYSGACSATDHALILGPLSDVSSYSYTTADCSIGTSGSHTFVPGPGDLFFLVVGDDGIVEGSYGRRSSGIERPSDDLLVPPVCPLAQSLTNRCD
jgi:hypothetical protein